ncbi:MAG: plasmid pRiA4b ORF-3 family protein [Acetobacteraceae bacterium]|nr:plasmid pRiA4b ORF-3 family protein [Acetobacteraceae bacterium]
MNRSTPAKPNGADSFNEICTLTIELLDSDPLIWRELEVPTSITLKTLHDVVQAAMGWFDSHLWEFRIGKQIFGLPMAENWASRRVAEPQQLA